MNLHNQKYQLDERPIEEGCGCPACTRHTRAYLRHLLKAGEMLAQRMLVMHNLYFYNHLMEKIRCALEQGTFAQFRRQWSQRLSQRI